MKPISGATPLAALEAVAIDSETTGLDTSTARIVQLAGIEIVLGQVRPGATFDTLVDPQMPIPPASTSFHGIDDAAVSKAPQIQEALQPFLDFCRDRLLIGHLIGFDLAVLDQEARRAGVEWHRPRSLCVRLLGAMVFPDLSDESLDALAQRLGVSVPDDYSAVGNARAAADVFVALVPALAERGVRTLAEAERACLSLSAQFDYADRPGWAKPVVRPELMAATGSIDPYAYRHRVRDVMSAPVCVVPAATTTRAAAELMVDQQISSVFVSETGAAGAATNIYGIVTERDVLRQIAAYGTEALERVVGDYASRPLASIAAGAFIYRAISRMERLQVRHLAVRDESERLAGVVSARDLLRLRGGAAIHLDDAIGEARSPQEMAQAWSRLPGVVRKLIEEDLDARKITGVISEEIRVMSRRAAQVAEVAMREAGRGGPPCAYSLLVLGPAGRGESLLSVAQHNAIVFERGDQGGPEDIWFGEFAGMIATTLAAAGIPEQSDGISARHPEWRGSVALWHARIDAWLDGSDLERDIGILIDQRSVQGDNTIAADLFDHFFNAAAGRPEFVMQVCRQLVEEIEAFPQAGSMQVDDGRTDLKRFGLAPIAIAARVLAIGHDIRRRSTAGRLEGLASRHLGKTDEIARILDAHRLFLRVMLEQQGRDLESGIQVSTLVDTYHLSRLGQADLRSALEAVRALPEMLRTLLA